MNRNGYTLVELIAMVVVIGVLMVITVPNIAGVLNRNKEKILTEDVHKMVHSAQQRMETNRAQYPTGEACVVMTLNFIDSSDDFRESANGGKYDMQNSYIVVKKERVDSASSKYKYYVRLVERKDGNLSVVNFVDYEEYVKNPTDYPLQPTTESALWPEADGADPNAVHRQLDAGHINLLAGRELCTGVVAAYE